MKKKRMKIIKLLVLPIVLFLFGCEKDLYDEHLHKAIVKSEISLEQFKKETGLNDFIPTIKIKLNDANSLQRNADGSYELSDFDIDTSIIKRIVVNEKITYTFQLIPKEEVNDRIFNIVYYFKEGWQYNIFEIKPTPENLIELKLGLTKKIDGTLTKVFQSFPVQTFDNCTVVTIWIENCWGCTGTCDGCTICLYHTSVLVCGQNPSYLYLDAGPSTGGGGGGGASSTTTNNNEVATSPILNTAFLDGPSAPEKTPCQKVKETTDNISGLKPIINNFKTPQVLNLNHEKGFNFVDNAQNQTQLVQNDGNANSTSITVVVTEDGAMSGLVHSHFDRPDMLPTFTFEDLMTFNSIYQYRKYNNKSLDNLTLMVVTRAGVFAMQIEDEAMFATNGYNLWPAPNQQLMDKFYKAIVEKENLTDEDVIVEVTKGLASYGIGMYQANADLSDWSKLTVDENNNKISTPCN